MDEVIEPTYIVYNGCRVSAPDWIHLPVDEQIQYQVKETLVKDPEIKTMMCFTFVEDRVPQIQKHIIEV